MKKLSKLKNCFKKILKNCDMFGQPLKMYLNRKDQYKSIFGGILSLTIVAFLFILGLKQILGLFYKTSFNVSQSDSYLSDPGELELKNNGFMFAFGFSNKLINQYGKKVFNIELSYKKNKRNVINNKIDKEKIKIPTEFCTEKHFQNHTKEFNQIHLDKYLCPKLDSYFNIQGGFHNQDFKYISIKILKCNPKNNNCINQTEIERIFTQHVYFEFYIVNNDIHIEDQKNPLRQYIKSDIHFLINPLTKLYKMADIFFSEIEIIDKYNPFVLSNNFPKIKTFIYKDEKREQANIYTEDEDEIANFYFRKSYYRYTYVKSYEDTFSILSYLGGLCGSLVVILGYFATTYNDFSYLLKISNFLFSFPCEKNNKIKEDKKLDLNKFNTITLQTEETEENGSIVKFMLQKITFYLESIMPLKPFITDIFTLFPFGDKYKRRKKLLKNAKKASKEHLNIGTILLKIQEIDRLKKILLTEEQNKVFSYFPKPNIFNKKIEKKAEDYLSKDDAKLLKNISTTKLDNYFKFVEMFNFVSELENIQEKNLFRKEINKRLVSLIYAEVKEMINFSLTNTNDRNIQDITNNVLKHDRRMSYIMNQFAERFSPVIRKSIQKRNKSIIIENKETEEEEKSFESN